MAASGGSLLLQICKVCGLVALYYPFSIGLTFYQKWLLARFPFSLFVVCVHYVIKFIASVGLRRLACCQPHRNKSGGVERVCLPWHEYVTKVAPIGLAASLDIGLSQWALQYITVSLYTMSKSTCIVFILIFAAVLGLEKLTICTIAIITLISGGLALFTYHSAQFDLTGFLLVELAAVCAGFRWAVSQHMMQQGGAKGVSKGHGKYGLSSPVDMIFHVQPWMLVSILPLVFVFEGRDLSMSTKVFRYLDFATPMHYLFLIAIGGVLALCMELSEYLLLVTTSSLTLNVCGIAKEVATLILAHFYAGDEFSPLNGLGLMLCLTGISLHVASKALASSKSSETPQQTFVDECEIDELNASSDRQPLMADSADFVDDNHNRHGRRRRSSHGSDH